MLGNGVKRKLDEGEDGVEEDWRPPQASYNLQRQTVLKMSLMKLYTPRVGADLGLQRRVLINNVIRRIHEDFRHERGVGALLFSAAPPTTASPTGHEDNPPSSFSILTALDSTLTPASLLEEDLPLFFGLPPPSSTQHPLQLKAPSPKDSFSSALEEIEELCPSSPSTSSIPSPPSPPPPARLLIDVVMKEEGRAFQEVKRAEKTTPSSSSGSLLSDFQLDDGLFTDIDTSMYDLGPGPGPPPSGTLPSKLTEDLVRYGSAGPGPQNQSFKMDLNELDHIMEVLVGS